MPVALITGASRGIGAAAAGRFARAGFDLLLTARASSELQCLVDNLSGSGCTVGAVPLDLSDPANEGRGDR